MYCTTSFSGLHLPHTCPEELITSRSGIAPFANDVGIMSLSQPGQFWIVSCSALTTSSPPFALLHHQGWSETLSIFMIAWHMTPHVTLHVNGLPTVSCIQLYLHNIPHIILLHPGICEINAHSKVRYGCGKVCGKVCMYDTVLVLS